MCLKMQHNVINVNAAPERGSWPQQRRSSYLFRCVNECPQVSETSTWTTRWRSFSSRGWGWWCSPWDGGLTRTSTGGCFTLPRISCSMSTYSSECIYLFISIYGHELFVTGVSRSASARKRVLRFMMQMPGSLCPHLLCQSSLISLPARSQTQRRLENAVKQKWPRAF